MTVTAGRARTAAFLVVAGAWFAMMAGSNVATPLYATYEREFGFSSAVLTLVFTTYALFLAPSLLLFGQLSDRLGRRRVMAAGFATATVGLVLFALAGSLLWLFAARAVQGLAVGMISGAAAAALVELDPAPQEDRAALFAALAQAGGSASGPIIAGMLAEWAPKPLVLPFVVFVVLGVVATVAALAIPEPGRVVPGRLRVVRPSVPPEIRVLFTRVSVTGAAVWAVAALFLSVVPSYAADLLDTSNLALLGAISARHAGHVVRGADRRPPLPRAHGDAGRGPRPARARPASRSSSPSRPAPCSSCCSRACSPAPATGSPSSARRRSSTSPPRPTAAARSTRPSTR